MDKNNSVKTNYENFCIRKGNLKLLPFKDFDFIGKQVVCQKCCQKFASKMSYRAHIGTDICIKTYNGPNLVYLNYKSKNCKQTRKKYKYHSDLNNHDIKKNILNPEMLNTLQTRNNCYSDNIIYQRNKIKEKQVNSNSSSSIKSDDLSVKKPRGRPKKTINVEPKKRGRPKKFNAVTGSSSSQSDNSIDNNLESYVTVNKPLIVNVDTPKDKTYDASAYSVGTHDVNVEKKQKLQSTMAILTEEYWNLVGAVCILDKDIIDKIHKISNEHNDKTQNMKEEKTTNLSCNEKEICLKLETLENELKSLSNQFEEIFEFTYEDELESMLSKIIEKRNEYKQHKLMKTCINNESTTNKGKENIQHTLERNEENTEINKSDKDFDQNEKNVWLNNDNRGNISPTTTTTTITVILNSSDIDNCESVECTDIEEINSNSTNMDNFEEALETITEDKTTNSNKSAYTNMKKNSDFRLFCKFCGKRYASIAEWKMHISAHLSIIGNKYLCNICGHKFNVRKNFLKHLSMHNKQIDLTSDKIQFNNLECNVCQSQHYYMEPYYDHLKTHNTQ